MATVRIPWTRGHRGRHRRRHARKCTPTGKAQGEAAHDFRYKMAQPYYVRTFDDTIDTLAGNVDAKDRVVEVVESHRSLAALARR